MGLFPQIQIVPNLSGAVNTVAGVAATNLGSTIDTNVTLGAPVAPIVNLGVTLGGGGPTLIAATPLLPVVESPLAGALTNALGSVLPQDGLAIDVNLDTSVLPVANLAVTLDGTGPILAIDLPILDQLAPVASATSGLTDTLGSVLPNLALDVSVNLGTEPSAPTTPVDPPAPSAGSGTGASPAPDAPATPSVPTGPDLSVGIDLGLGGGSSGGSATPTAPATGSEPAPVEPTAPATGDGTPTSPESTPTSPRAGTDVSVEIDLGLGGGSGGASHGIPSPAAGADPTPVDPIGSGVPQAPSTGAVTGGAGVPTDHGGTGAPPATSVTTATGGPVFSGGVASSGGSLGAEAAIQMNEPGGGMSLAQSIDWGHRDWLEGNDGNNILMGLSGNDTIYGHGGDDILYGNQNDDRLFGGQGNDILHGGRDNDYLSGDEGDDELWGDYGDDLLEGGDGADVFHFDLNSGNDTILDFNAAEGDRLDFHGQDYAIHQVAGTAVITLSGGGAVMLNGISAAGLDAFIIG